MKDTAQVEVGPVCIIPMLADVAWLGDYSVGHKISVTMALHGDVSVLTKRNKNSGCQLP